MDVIKLSQFKVGDSVRWTSQSQGFTTVKEGIVIAVLPPKAPLSGVVRTLDQEKFNLNPIKLSIEYGSRDEQSYVVAVPTPAGRGSQKIYWPRTQYLLPNESAT